MPSIVYRFAVTAANTVTKGLLNGNLHEYVQAPGRISIYGIAKIADLNLTINLGGRIVMADQSMPCNTAIAAGNSQAVKPDNLIYTGRVRRGDRIQVDARNVTAIAAANDAMLIFDVVPG